MEYTVNFGRLTKPAQKRPEAGKFRLALLGDFFGHGDSLPHKVDVDRIDDVLARRELTLKLAFGDEVIEVPIRAIDDFHPDQLVENVALFESLRALRKRLANPATFAAAATEIGAWAAEPALPPSVAVSDFARLTGRAPSEAPPETQLDALVRRLVGPFVQNVSDQQQQAVIRQVDEALSAAMRRVLHHPDFQAAEALWRGVDLLVRRIETDATLEIVLYDLAAPALAADLAAHEALEESALYAMLVEQPLLDAAQGPLSAVIGLYGFALSPSHADLLGRIAKVCAAAGAPFIAAIEPDALQIPLKEQSPEIQAAWTALQGLPESAYLGLATVGFLLRLPYGKRGDPIDAFAFEELTDDAIKGSAIETGVLWANPALAVGLLLAQAWEADGADMAFGDASVIDDLPSYVHTGANGDQIMLPMTARVYSEREAVQAARYHVMPLVSQRGRPEARLAGCQSVAGVTLAGPWPA